MTKDIAIRVEGVWKSFTRSTQRRGLAARIPLFASKEEKFWAIKDVSFELEKGQSVGIIGRNGAGKSTLLRIASGITQPDQGNVEINTKIDTIFALQAGFKPNNTGSENIFLKGATMGLNRQQIDAVYDAIVRFADIGPFIDAPLTTYSTGMRGRLAFAIAFAFTPETLVIDEGLAVGDVAFNRKCYVRLAEIRESGATLLIVSHGAFAVFELCDRAIFIDSGERMAFGKARTIYESYRYYANTPLEAKDELRNNMLAADKAGVEWNPEPTKFNSHVARDTGASIPSNVASSISTKLSEGSPSFGVKITDPRINKHQGGQTKTVIAGEPYDFIFLVRFQQPGAKVWFRFRIKTLDDIELYCARSHKEHEYISIVDQGQILNVQFPVQMSLFPGKYLADIEVWGSIDNKDCLLHSLQNALLFSVEGAPTLTTGLTDLSLGRVCIINDTVKESKNDDAKLRAGARPQN